MYVMLQVTLRVNNVPAECRGNCGYEWSADLTPRVTSVSQTSGQSMLSRVQSASSSNGSSSSSSSRCSNSGSGMCSSSTVGQENFSKLKHYFYKKYADGRPIILHEHFLLSMQHSMQKRDNIEI